MKAIKKIIFTTATLRKPHFVEKKNNFPIVKAIFIRNTLNIPHYLVKYSIIFDISQSINASENYPEKHTDINIIARKPVGRVKSSIFYETLDSKSINFAAVNIFFLANRSIIIDYKIERIKSSIVDNDRFMKFDFDAVYSICNFTSSFIN